jgi:arabinoxylan arabinofuranohydrolase
MEKNKKLAFNPYLPGYEYIPDGEPYVFDDRVYIYGSHDESKSTKFCIGDYVCWSAPVDDLGNWSYEGVIYKKTQDPMNLDGSHAMFAPDVAVGPDGRYYLYYGLDFTGTISVAVCDTPAGKYEFYGMVHYENEDGSEKVLRDNIPYDPSVMVDDGKVYLY